MGKFLGVVLSCFTLLASTAGAQINPIARYNNISESGYLLNRCGALTAERLAWLKLIRGHAMQSLGWDEARAAEQEEILTREFGARYREVSKEKCAEVARGADQERTTTKIAP
ncbi:MAG TPA: hypothetical protein VF943_07205 [Burkholderiales bacterium]